MRRQRVDLLDYTFSILLRSQQSIERLPVLRKEGEISTIFSKPDFASPKVPFQ